MRGYQTLVELTGSTNIPDFADKLRSKGIKYYDEQTYRMAEICHEDPDKIQTYGREFAGIIPQTIKTILAWEESIVNIFQNEQKTPISDESTIKDIAYSYIYDRVIEIANEIPFNAKDSLVHIGACYILKLNPEGLTLGDVLSKLFNE